MTDYLHFTVIKHGRKHTVYVNGRRRRPWWLRKMFLSRYQRQVLRDNPAAFWTSEYHRWPK